MSVDEFCNYLESKGYVLKKQIPYYSRWVTQFLQFSNTRSDQIPPDRQMDHFLSSIEKRCEQWQIEQAKEAISLYLFFISRKRSPVAKKERGWNADWVEAGEMMKRMLRLKHLAYGTEQSNIIWLRDFFRHVPPTVPKQLDGANSPVASPKAPELMIPP